jgi:hypothetical protein
VGSPRSGSLMVGQIGAKGHGLDGPREGPPSTSRRSRRPSAGRVAGPGEGTNRVRPLRAGGHATEVSRVETVLDVSTRP